MSAAPGDDARAKTAELVAGLSPREQIDLLAQALLREHMHRCGFKRTLKAFDTECPRDARTIASRAVMRQMLNIPPEGRPSRLQRIRAHCSSETDSKAAPVAPTFMEELCSYRLTKREHLLRSQGTDNTNTTQTVEEEEEDDVDSEAELAELREKAAERQRMCREAEAMIEEGRQLAARKAERRRKRANKDNVSGAEKNDDDDDDASNDSSKEPSSRYHHHHSSHKKDKQGKAKKGTGRKHRKQRQSESNALDDEATQRVGELEEEEPTFLTGVTWHGNSDSDEEQKSDAAAKALLTVRAVGSGWQPPQSSSSVASTTATAAAVSLRGAPLPVPDTAITSATTLAPTVSLRDAPAVPRHSLSSTSLHDPSTTSAATKDSTTAAIDSVDEIFAPSETQATIKDIREELRRTSGNASLARSPPATQSTTSNNSYLDPFARPRTSLTGLGTATTSSTGGMMTSPHAAPLVIPERQEILKVWQPSTHATTTPSTAASGSRPGMFRPASFGGSGGLTSSVKPVNSGNVAAGAARHFAAPATSSILMHNAHSGLTASMSGSAATHAQDSSMESEATTPPAKTASLYSYDSAAQPRSSALVSRGGGAGGATRISQSTTTTSEGLSTSGVGAGSASALQAKRQGVGFHTATAGDESGDKEKRRKRKVTLLVD